MKYFIAIFLLLFSTCAKATDYYFSSVSGDDSRTAAQAQNSSTPWKTIGKLNDYFASIQSGDRIFFKRGETFYGTIIPTTSKTYSTPVIIGAYGTGAAPVITGFTTVSSWTSIGNGVYESSSGVTALADLRVVTMNGVNQPMGRFPDIDAAKGGYMNQDSDNDDGSAGAVVNQFTDAELPASTTVNLKDAEIAIRRSRFQLYPSYKVTAHSGRTLTYSPAYNFDTNDGYFIQNHPWTVTKQGEWYFNPTSKKLRMHFGTSTPSNFVVKVASLDYLVNMSRVKGLVIRDLDMQGANNKAIYGDLSKVSILNNSIRFATRNAIDLVDAVDCRIDSNYIEDIGNNGIDIDHDGANGNVHAGTVIRYNTLNRIGVVKGGGLDGDNKYTAIYTTGQDVWVEYNRIDSCGYAAIMFSSHNNIYMRYNYITQYCNMIDDGGGIYTAQHSTPIKILNNRIVEGNILLNSGDPRFGISTTMGGAYAIYIDDGANGVDILNNTIAHVSHSAIYVHNAFNVTVRGNHMYDFLMSGFYAAHSSGRDLIRDLHITQNYTVARDSAQNNRQAMIYLQSDASDDSFTPWGVIDSNYYASPTDAAGPFKHRLPGDDIYTTFSNWKAKTPFDDHSIFSPKTFPANGSSYRDSIQLHINPTGTATTVNLGSRKFVDAKGVGYSGTVTIAPYSSVILLANGVVIGGAPTGVARAGADSTVFKNQSRPDSAFLHGNLSTDATSYSWQVTAYPSGTSAPTIVSSTSQNTWITGLKEGVTRVRLTINGNGNLFDDVEFTVRDWMKKNVTATRSGGGQNIVVPPTHSGTVNGKKWNKWEFITNLNTYLSGLSLPTPQAGDTLWFEGGADSTAWVEIGNFGGNQANPITVRIGHPTDTSKQKPMNGRGKDWRFWVGVRDSNVVCYVNFDFNWLRRKRCYPYGLVVNNSGIADASIANGAVNMEWVHHVSISGVKATKTKWGMQMQLYANAQPFSRMDKFIQRKITIDDNYIDSALVEGFYIGKTDADNSITNGVDYGPGPRMDSVEISNNVVTNSQWDGIQLANARYGNSIHHNLVYNSGYGTTDPSQQAGILMGSNTNGNVFNNTVIRSRGIGVQHLGFGQVSISANYIDSSLRGNQTSDGIYIRSTPILYDGASNPTLVATVNNNIVSRPERYHIGILQNSTFPQGAGTFTNNTFLHQTLTSPATMINGAATGSTISGNVVKNTAPSRIASFRFDELGPVIAMTQGSLNETFSRELNVSTPRAINDWLFDVNSGFVVNQPPVADAGTDKTLTLPVTSVNLTASGSDPDGTVLYFWSFISKPSGAPDPVLSSTTGTSISVTNLTTVGNYVFRFLVRDDDGAEVYDDVTVTVNAIVVTEPNKPPTVNAGGNKAISLPNTTVLLQGSGADTDGAIVSYKWEQISGPTDARIASPADATTLISLLGEGVYTFRFTVTDNNEAFASGSVVVTVTQATDAKQTNGVKFIITQPDRKRVFSNK